MEITSGPDAISSPSPVPCTNCKNELPSPEVKFCASCGFPQGGTDEERVQFYRKGARIMADRQERDKRVQQARNILFVVAVVNMVPYLITRNWTMIVVGLIVSLIFTGLGIWAKYRPFPAILTGFILFIVLNVMAMIQDPSNIYKGIIIKVLAFTALLYALRAIKRAEASSANA